MPPIEKKTVGKMGLKGVPGLNIVSEQGGGGGGRQNQQQRGPPAKNPRSEGEFWLANGSPPTKDPARSGPGRGPMRGAKRQHAAPY